MANGPTLETERLILRQWRDDDMAPFAAMNAAPRVMATIGTPLDRAASDALIERARTSFVENGFGLWAVEVRGGPPCIGFIGLAVPRFDAHFTPAVEVGWRLAFDHWGEGFATEGARAALGFAFEVAGLDEVVSFTAEINTRSRAVMKRLGMTRNPADDFDHPKIPAESPLCRHVLYRLARA